MVVNKPVAESLQLRSLSAGVASDKANLVDFYVEVFTDAYGPEDKILAPWVSDLISGKHPAMSADDVWVVVDPTQEDRIVSALLLIPQTWSYEGIDFGVGRVELVATHKEYRRRGLIRELMQVAHERSAALGHQVQVITGIEHFYRQFGYAMTLPLGGGAYQPFAGVPKLRDGEHPKYTLQGATEDDVPVLMDLYNAHTQHTSMYVHRNEAYWRYQFQRSPKNPPNCLYHLIKNTDGQTAGYVATQDLQQGGRLSCLEYCLDANTSYLETYDDVLRGLKDHAESFWSGDDVPYFIGFDTSVHPTIKLMASRSKTGYVRPYLYTWYVRVADLPAFLMHLKPLLDDRMTRSGARGFTGDFNFDFHDHVGLQLKFEGGKLVHAGPKPSDAESDASFPWHTFLHTLFGDRTMEEMRHILPDVDANRKGTVLLNALFSQPSRPPFLLGIW
jgi:GNAT superfamily N-acetyltransferase